MPLIKLIKVYSLDYEREYYDPERVTADMSDWQEVTHEELTLLQSWKGREVLGRDNISVQVYEDVTDEINAYVTDIRDYIQKLAAKEAAEKEKARKVNEERKKKAEKTKIERAKKLLEKNGIKTV